ncbi:hypothetical protein DICVIV_03900 [Dictyocaulus viviparus]|uniref:Uncharacterized protein n=1 Tax=Dictyocaulus viviparus TaxID=29172 RepID=A0A0D8XZ78_DICVI|nr:hypothetical protein DICVIV_03900 [Dictyocaulus viviparus]
MIAAHDFAMRPTDVRLVINAVRKVHVTDSISQIINEDEVAYLYMIMIWTTKFLASKSKVLAHWYCIVYSALVILQMQRAETLEHVQIGASGALSRK